MIQFCESIRCCFYYDIQIINDDRRKKSIFIFYIFLTVGNGNNCYENTECCVGQRAYIIDWRVRPRSAWAPGTAVGRWERKRVRDAMTDTYFIYVTSIFERARVQVCEKRRAVQQLAVLGEFFLKREL